MNSRRLNLSGVTTAALIAGRSCFAELTAEQVAVACDRLDVLAKERGLPLALCVGSDLSGVRDDHVGFSLTVGLLVAATDDPSPQPVDGAALQSALERSADIPWEHIENALRCALEADRHLSLCATGPLAGALLAYGVPATYDEETDVEWAPGSPQAQEPTLEFSAGKDRGRTLREGVWGARISYVGDWATEAIEQRVSDPSLPGKLRSLASSAGFFLAACCD